MARHLAWVIAILLCAPGVGRASTPGGCELARERAQATQQRGAQAPAAGRQGDKPGGRGDDHGPRAKWWIDPQLRAELGVTDQQSAAVEQIWKKSLPALVEGRQRLEKLEDALSQMTAADASDEAAVIAQIERVENLRAELTKGRTLMIYRMDRMLTPDQRVKVKAMYERRDASRRGGSPR